MPGKCRFLTAVTVSADGIVCWEVSVYQQLSWLGFLKPRAPKCSYFTEELWLRADLCTPKLMHVEVLTPSVSENNSICREGLSRDSVVKMKALGWGLTQH